MDGLGDVLGASFEFPTIIFTVLALLSLSLLLLSTLGLDVDGGADGAVDGATDGVLEPLGLADVPFGLLAALLTCIGWLVSVMAQMFLLDGRSGWLLIGLAVFVGIVAAAVALGITALLAPRLAAAFETKSAIAKRDLVGRIAEVRSSRVNDSFGYADVAGDHGGVLRVEVRTSTLSPDKLADTTVGTKVLLVSFDEAQDAFIVGASPFELDP